MIIKQKERGKKRHCRKRREERNNFSKSERHLANDWVLLPYDLFFLMDWTCNRSFFYGCKTKITIGLCQFLSLLWATNRTKENQRVHNKRFIHICARQRQHNNTVSLIISLCDGGHNWENNGPMVFMSLGSLSLFLLSVLLELKLITTVVHVKMCQRSIQFRLKLDTICRLQLSPQRTREQRSNTQRELTIESYTICAVFCISIGSIFIAFFICIENCSIHSKECHRGHRHKHCVYDNWAINVNKYRYEAHCIQTASIN